MARAASFGDGCQYCGWLPCVRGCWYNTEISGGGSACAEVGRDIWDPVQRREHGCPAGVTGRADLGRHRLDLDLQDSERSAPSRSKMGHNILLIFNFSLFIEMYFSCSVLHPMPGCSSLDGSSSQLSLHYFVKKLVLSSQPIATMNLSVYRLACSGSIMEYGLLGMSYTVWSSLGYIIQYVPLLGMSYKVWSPGQFTQCSPCLGIAWSEDFSWAHHGMWFFPGHVRV